MSQLRLPCHMLFDQPVDGLSRCLPPRSFTWARIQGMGNGVRLVDVVLAEVRTLGEVLAEQNVGVLVAAMLPGALRGAEVNLETCIDPQLRVSGHLGALVPAQRATQAGKQAADRLCDGAADRFGTA